MNQTDPKNAGNGNNPEVKVTLPKVKRLRASGPILILAVLFVLGAFLTWYFTWFGRSLSDADITTYLADQKHSRRVQHALLQVQERIAQGDSSARQWYPELVRLAGDPETEFRLTVAWVMGFDNKAEEFHQTLLQLLRDPQPIVRRNAALALVRFNDASGRPELIAMLKPFEVQAPVNGLVASTLKEAARVARGTLLVRITKPEGTNMEVRSPLLGKLERILAPTGTNVAQGQTLLTINSDEDSIWEALRGLSLIGQPEDLPLIERYAQDSGHSSRIQEQAALTAKAIRQRAA